jgi:hypothetical protein
VARLGAAFQQHRVVKRCALCRGTKQVEIFSAADWWTRPPDEVLRVRIERFNTVC